MVVTVAVAPLCREPRETERPTEVMVAPRTKREGETDGESREPVLGI
jgi:hypothetical protein